MPDTTPLFGITIPKIDGSDPPAAWPGLAVQGFLDVENHFYLTADSKQASNLPATWPKGTSLMPVTTTGAANGGWGKSNGAIFTASTGSVAYQFYYSGTVNPEIWFRGGLSSGWSPWLLVVGRGTAVSASGTYTFNNASAPRTDTIAFPANRFTTTPVVVATTHNSAVVVAVNGKSATGCNLLLSANGGAATFPNGDYQVDWVAYQNN